MGDQLCSTSPDWQDVLTIASIPAAHPYVSSTVDGHDVTLLADPVPPGATERGQWWPPQYLEPDFLRARLGEVELMHVHFGFDATSVEQLAEVADLLAGRRIPLVVTVHDLTNPHFVDQKAHAERLDVLMRAATTVITLTDGAAAEIGLRWGREAVVLPHPHVLPIEDVGARRESHGHPIVGIHAKNLRANVDPWPLLDRLIDAPGAEWCAQRIANGFRYDRARVLCASRCDSVDRLAHPSLPVPDSGERRLEASAGPGNSCRQCGEPTCSRVETERGEFAPTGSRCTASHAALAAGTITVTDSHCRL